MAERSLDLDALRTARAEALGEIPTIHQGGETFQLPTEVPMGFVWATVEGDDRAALEALFNGDLERFLATRPTREDVLALITGIPALYGLHQGESPASAGSSPNGGSHSRPTSSVTTKPTFAKRASARKQSG